MAGLDAHLGTVQGCWEALTGDGTIPRAGAALLLTSWYGWSGCDWHGHCVLPSRLLLLFASCQICSYTLFGCSFCSVVTDGPHFPEMSF